MARDGLKTLSYAYKQVDADTFEGWTKEHDIESTEFREELEAGLVYLGTFGLEDPLRPDIRKSVDLIKYGKVTDETTDMKNVKNQVNIRMVTGDNMEAAISVAKATGIITAEEAEYDGIFLTGEQFKERIGEYTIDFDESKNRYEVKFHNMERFRTVKSRLRIIARATAEDKLLLVSGIKQAGGLVAMSGESIADARALKEADVGLCMGTGCQVAKDNSDLIILDNQFGSIYRAIRWGRAIFDNVRKFIQFQMTLNLVLCFSVLFIGMTLGDSPFKVIHLLWANLVMDVLGAIALGTEPPPGSHFEHKSKGDAEGADEKLLQKEREAAIPASQANRISRKEKIIIPSMWRTIFTQATYQILVIIILQYFGTLMYFDAPYNLVTEYETTRNWVNSTTQVNLTDLVLNETLKPGTPEWTSDIETVKVPTNGHVVNTMIFHTFMLMNLFNSINCRVIDQEEKVVFKTIFNNITFWIIFGIEMAIQWIFMYGSSYGGEILSDILGCAELTQSQ